MAEKKDFGKCYICGGNKITPTSICFSCSKDNTKQTRWIFIIQNGLVGSYTVLITLAIFTVERNLLVSAFLGIPAIIFIFTHFISLRVVPRLFLNELRKTVREQKKGERVVMKFCKVCNKAQLPIKELCPDCGHPFDF